VIVLKLIYNKIFVKNYNVFIYGKEVIIIKNKKLLLSLGLFFVALLFTGCALFNSAPVITSDPITTAQEGVLYTDTIEATDPEGDTLTYSLITRPDGMTINSSTGVISWTPTGEQIGENEVEVEVSDLYKSTTQAFTIVVGEAILTSIEVLPPTMRILKGGTDTIDSITAHYSNGTEVDIALTACDYESDRPLVTVSSNGVISVSSICAATTATITVSYLTKTDTVIVTVPG